MARYRCAADFLFFGFNYMGLFNLLKELFTSDSPTMGELNKIATQQPINEIKSIEKKETEREKKLSRDLLTDLTEIEVTNEYRLIKQLIENQYPFIFVNGKAGSGKSTLIRYIRSSFKEKNIVVVAPTGVAALNVSGSTIHSFFHFPPRIIDDRDIQKVKDRRLYSKLNIIIIDEVSMVRVDVVDAIDKFMRLNGPRQGLPFGGVQIIFIGDLFQLPPVVNSEEEEVLNKLQYSSPYFFSAKSLEHYKVIPVELNKIFRQKDARFMEILNDIRVASNLETRLPVVNERLNAIKNEKEIVITLTSKNVNADNINKLELNKLNGEIKLFHGKTTGTFAIEKERLPSPLELALKVGAQVMFTKNDKLRQWVNGTIGKVMSFNNDTIQVMIHKDQVDHVVDVNYATWESYAYRYDQNEDKIVPYITGSYTQIPLMLAWAVTIHKSQGKTLGKIKLDVGDGAFASGQVYVALSRIRTLSDLSLSRTIKKSDVKSDQRIKRFFENLQPVQNRISQLANDPNSGDLSISDQQCPYCWNKLREVNGKNGKFTGCSGYPKCTYTRN